MQLIQLDKALIVNMCIISIIIFKLNDCNAYRMACAGQNKFIWIVCINIEFFHRFFLLVLLLLLTLSTLVFCWRFVFFFVALETLLLNAHSFIYLYNEAFNCILICKMDEKKKHRATDTDFVEQIKMEFNCMCWHF